MTTSLKACVIGHPVAHSRSPLIHGYWLKKHGINGTYDKRDVAPENLAAFLTTLDEQGLRGCNITIPNKEQALKFVDEVDDVSRRIGSINTVWIENGKRKATTTDGIGFCTNVEQTLGDFRFKDQRVTMIGAGGSSRPIIAEMLNRGAAEVIIANRSAERADEVAGLFDKRVKSLALDKVNTTLKQTDVLINTTSIGLNGETEYPADLNLLPEHAVVTDIVYVPLETPLIQNAKARKLRTVPGLGMLLHQAVFGFEKWFGHKPKVTQELYDLVAADLAKAAH